MRSVCVDFILGNDCPTKGSRTICQENVPETTKLVQASNITRFEMYKDNADGTNMEAVLAGLC
jgi:hypothetical protein